MENLVEQHYTVKELEHRLGVSRSTLDRLANKGELEKVKFGNNPKEANELLKAQRYSVESTQIKIAYDHILDFAQHFATKTEVNGLIMGSTRKANTPETANQYLYGAYLYYCECSNIKNPLTKMAFKQAFKNAMRELQQGDIQTRLKDGRNVTNVYFINYANTLNEWQG